METVLVVGATGRVGVSAVLAALRTGRKVLAVVRNHASADNMFRHVGTKGGITTVVADVLSENGIQGVVEKVKAGMLPAFQHVYSTVGRMYALSPLQDIDMSTYRECMDINLNANLYTYRATIPYLLLQKDVKCTYTQITGASSDSGLISITGMSQGALVSMMNAAILENSKTNVRINEVYLSYLVVYDAESSKHKIPHFAASQFARHYEQILQRPEIDGCRVSVYGPKDLEDIKFHKKITHSLTNESVKEIYELM